MRYALLIYGQERVGPRDTGLDPGVAAVLAQPSVADWARLYDADSATTVTYAKGRTLLTDGPFLDTKEFIAGLVMVEADDLDGAIRVAEELQQEHPGVPIEIRPVLETA